jgi:hypothetical protein
MKTKKTLKGNEVMRGMAVRTVRYYWADKDVPEEQRVLVVADADQYDYHKNTYELLGKAKSIKLPGAEYDAFLFDGRLFVGCQTIDAEKAFRSLGKALGYEITG